MHELDSYYLSKTQPNRSCLLALRKIILEQDEAVTETRKYGMPCFCFKNKMFCYLWTDKKTDWPYILFVEGNHLNHPELNSGDRKRMKQLTIDPNSDLPKSLIERLLDNALNLYRTGVIQIK